jgi:hypothetical protein
VDVEVRPFRSLGLPVARGERVGELVVIASGEELGEVPVVAAESVLAIAPVRLPWWRRAWEAITSFLADAMRPVLEGRSL